MDTRRTVRSMDFHTDPDICGASERGNGPFKLLLTVTEAAAALGLSRSVVYELTAAGALESVTIGRSRRVPVAALHDFVARLRHQSESSTDVSTPLTAT